MKDVLYLYYPIIQIFVNSCHFFVNDSKDSKDSANFKYREEGNFQKNRLLKCIHQANKKSTDYIEKEINFSSVSENSFGFTINHKSFICRQQAHSNNF